jgi:nitrite reductase (NADH) small subunit
MGQWAKIADVSDCPPGTAREIVVGERVVALFNIEGTLYALDGVCPHQGGPLAEGEVTGCVVTCPWHGWQFDVRTGQHQFSATIRQPTLSVRIEGNAVMVELE